MWLKCSVFLLVCFGFASASASEVAFKGLPFEVKELFDEIDKHQLTYTSIRIGAEGKGTVTTKFSNGKQLDGDHFVTYTQFLDDQGHVLAIVRLAKGLNGSGGGKAKEGTVSSGVSLPIDQWSRVKRVRVLARTEGSCKDEKFWGKVAQKVARDAVKYYFTGNLPSAAAGITEMKRDLDSVCK